MNLSKLIAMAGVIGGWLFVGNVSATTVNGPGLQTVLNNMTTAPTPGASSVNVNTDQVSDDEYWAVTGSGGSVSTMVIELSGNASSNIFGIFDASDSTKQVTIFNGASVAGSQALLSIKDDGSVHINFGDSGVDFLANNFGFFLKNSQGTFYSDTGLNGDQFDHMVAYQGKGTDTIKLPGLAPGVWTTSEYLLGWEDTFNGGDGDYEDMVVMIESVKPTPLPPQIVPVPAAVWLFGSALAGMGTIGGWRRRASAA